MKCRSCGVYMTQYVNVDDPTDSVNFCFGDDCLRNFEWTPNIPDERQLSLMDKFDDMQERELTLLQEALEENIKRGFIEKADLGDGIARYRLTDAGRKYVETNMPEVLNIKG